MRDLHHVPSMALPPKWVAPTAAAGPLAHAPGVALRPDGLSGSTPSPSRHGVLRPAPT